MQLSVVILNYKVPYHLLLCLESVSRSIVDIDAEIIVVDNCSEDESCDLVQLYFPEVKLIKNQNNDGFSKGNNLGIKRAKGDYICLLNPDTAVGENTFKHLLSFAKAHPDCGAIGPKLIDGCGHFLPESKRNIPTPKVALKKLFNQPKSYYSSLAENTDGPVDILVGAFMLIPRHRYWEVGGLDEDYFMYGEDIDLSYKLLKAGYQNYYVGTETVLHYKGESTAKNAVYRKRFYGAMMIFYQKHFNNNSYRKHLVHLGLRLARASHNLRFKSTICPKTNAYYYWIGNAEGHTDQLETKFKQHIQHITPQQLHSATLSRSTLIFDAETLAYQTIFEHLQHYCLTDNQFRIKPSKFNYIIGSDSSTGQGQVTHLDSSPQLELVLG